MLIYHSSHGIQYSNCNPFIKVTKQTLQYSVTISYQKKKHSKENYNIDFWIVFWAWTNVTGINK